ncbi:MAG: hypothetical protein DLM70_02920 [Chloroflexi bacterium]|nr:MAG: hypothetical protein DLM70_02920 [Chloroflexota bacterium]
MGPAVATAAVFQIKPETACREEVVAVFARGTRLNRVFVHQEIEFAARTTVHRPSREAGMAYPWRPLLTIAGTS